MQSCDQQSQTFMRAPAMQCRLMRTPGTNLKVLFTSIRARYCALLAGKIKIGNGVTLRNHIACNVECSGPSSVRFLFRYAVSNTQRPSYMQTARRGTIHLLTSINLTTTTNNCICLQKESKQGGSHGKSHQECYIGERYSATESVEPDSLRPTHCTPTVALSTCK